MFAQKKHVQVVLFDLHMRKIGQREALLIGVKRGLAPLAGCGAAPRVVSQNNTEKNPPAQSTGGKAAYRVE